MSNEKPVGTAFADNLGTALGGCVRDQTVVLFNRDVAASAGVKLCPIPFAGEKKKRGFKIRWAALLAGAGLWSAITEIPELGRETRLLNRTERALAVYADEALEGRLLGKVTPEERETYEALRKAFLALARRPSTRAEDFAKAFLDAVRAWDPASAANPERALRATTHRVTEAAHIFSRLAQSLRESPCAYDPNAFSGKP